MAMRVYALLAERVLTVVLTALDAAAATWARDWGVASPALVCRRAWDGAVPASYRTRFGAADGEGSAWLAWPDALPGALQRELFGADRGVQAVPGGEAELAAASASAALSALETALGVAVLDLDPQRSADTSSPASLRAAGSGAVLAELRFERHTLSVLLDAAAVTRCAASAVQPQPAPLAALDYRALLDRQPVRLSVDAGRANVALGSLLALAPGDVIRLDTLADAPLAARGADGAILLRGYLGARGPHLALDLVAGAESSGEHA